MKTAFEHAFAGEVTRFTDGALVTSRLHSTKEEALSLFQGYAPGVRLSDIQEAYVRFYGVDEDGEFAQKWWLEWTAKRGSKPVWVVAKEAES